MTPFALANDHTGPPNEGETVEIGTNVTVWERAILTTRADTSDAVETVPNADWSIRNQNNDETNLNKNPVPIYEKGATVSITFDEDKANKGDLFGDTEVQIVRAHVQGSGDSSVPSSTADAVDLLNPKHANDNASFKLLGTKRLNDGARTFSDTVSESGQYVYFLALEEGDGFDVDDNGKLSVKNNVTVIGAEHVAVRKPGGTVDAPDSVVRGNDASFEVDASHLQGEPLTQGVVVYDQETYVRQVFIAEITGDLDSDFDLEKDSTLHTSVDEVNGVASLEDDIERFGLSLNDDRVARSAGIESLMDFISESAGQEVPDNVEIDENSDTLDASITVTAGPDSSPTIDVETFDNWSTGEYRWIYVATGENSQELYVDTATIQVEEAKTGGGGDPGGGGGSPGGGGGGGGGLGTPIPTETPTPTATDTPEPTETTPTETETETPTETETMTETETPTDPPLLDGDPADPPSDDGGLPMPVIVIGIAVVAAIIGAALLFLRP